MNRICLPMELSILDGTVLAAAFICMGSWALWRRRSSVNASYPPGPKGLPLVGNILDMPNQEEWETARQWGEKYGDLVFVRNFGTPYLFVNSYDAAVDLLEKRGSIYSSRPANTMLDLEGWTQWFTSTMPYGDELRKSRQYLHRFLQQSAIKDYYDLQTQSTHKLLVRFLEDPDNFLKHIRFSVAESIIMLTYGYQVADNDPHVELVDKGMEAFGQALTFFLVNAFPALRHLPEWFPKADFHSIAKEGYKLSMAMYHELYAETKVKIANGSAVPSMTSKLIESNTDRNGLIADEATIAKAVGISYGGGGDTTVSMLQTFMLAIVLYPEVMRKGQEELDRVIGRDILPTFEDRSKLPYINAVCTECLRWQTVAPLGIAHMAEKDDIYNGYFIPAGTSVFANAWAMLRNPKDYPEPDKFVPERWLSSEAPLNANKMAFGFGRRICPGRYLAENSAFIFAASVLAVFNIEKAVDELGVPITPPEEYTTNAARHVKPFKCKISPRSDEAAALVREAGSLAK